MKKSVQILVAMAAITMLSSAFAQEPGRTVTPASTAMRTVGKPHTSIYLFIPDKGVISLSGIPGGETPPTIACAYGMTTPVSGCPKSLTQVPTGGAKAIAVVEYGTYSSMQSDFNTFNTQFGLPAATITTICSPAPPCPNNAGSGWDLETALDVQYAHSMAPNAQIIVSAFSSDPIGDGAETAAANAVASAGGGEVSNSWTYNGGEEWCGSGNCELQYDSYFVKSGVIFFGSAGDSGLGTAYPSISPNVISAGGTGFQRDSNGNFTGETCWSGSGGGLSQYEPLPQYQLYVANKTNFMRGSPDWAAIASNSSPVDIYSSSYCGGWCEVYGTSVASPVLAGIVNWAGQFRTSTVAELSHTYQWYIRPVTYKTNFYDVETGNNGAPAGFGWDQCTGLGSIRKPLQF